MNPILSFLKKEFIQLKRDKRILPILIVAPVLQLIILGYAATFDVKNLDFALCDLDKSLTSKRLISSFTSSSYFISKISTDNLNQIDALFKSDEIDSALIIPRNFEKNLYSGAKTDLLFLTDGTEGTSASVSLSYARIIANRFFQEIKGSYSDISPELNFEIRIWHNPELKSAFFMVPAIFAILLSVISMLIPSMAIVKEKETGTIEQLFVTPIKPYQIIAGKMTAFMIISAIDVVLVTLIAVFWFNVPFRGGIMDFTLAIILFLFSTLGIATFFSSITNTQQQAMMSVMFLFFLPSMLLSGFIFPVENIPYPIRAISYLLPLTYFIEILRSLFLKGCTIVELLNQYIMLGILGITLITIGIIKFKKSN